MSMDLRESHKCAWSILLILAAVSGPLAGCSTQHIPDPTTVSTVTITTTAIPTQTSAAALSPSPREGISTSVVSAVVSNEVLTDVDPRQYWDRHNGAGYFFVSPSGNLSCGFTPFPGVQYVGCQTWVKVANFPRVRHR